ncbi:TatD family hydrolase [Myxococcota bacterium]|nr:TatD family hydrolase [Myxococcota bacterium]MBU1536797.1 TatD family hydrolase [Myxococcota bacterium]
MIDTHCHLFDPPLDLTSVLARLGESSLSGLVCVATYQSSWENMIASFGQVKERLPHAFLALGVHPWFVEQRTPDWEEQLKVFLHGASAVGEIGLDRGPRAPSIDIQMAPFEIQMAIARDMNLPALLHVVKAHDLVLHHLKQFPRSRGIIHAFSGSPQEARFYIDQGWFLGVGGSIARENAHRLRRIIRGIPLEALVLETDSPYMGTPGCTPGGSWPGETIEVARHLAKIRGDSLERVLEVTTGNALGIFES